MKKQTVDSKLCSIDTAHGSQYSLNEHHYQSPEPDDFHHWGQMIRCGYNTHPSNTIGLLYKKWFKLDTKKNINDVNFKWKCVQTLLLKSKVSPLGHPICFFAMKLLDVPSIFALTIWAVFPNSVQNTYLKENIIRYKVARIH